ncbi:MAG: hypothetical protein RMJ43_03490 [Chloroherpetonaceae bacterium]|nr:hypothetical protein [Chthonomonadaceae bacterium]MDW8206875.1 hypothetical protein [Chloroherpetonaceae bacterium]
MKHAVRWIAGILVLAITVWLATAGLAWSRNRLPAPLPSPVEAPPADNAYPDYLQCVRALQQKNQLLSLPGDQIPDASTRASLLTPNREMLARFHRLHARPAVATYLEPGKDFVAALDFLPFGRLIALEAQDALPGAPDRALHTLVDGLIFADRIQNGGTTLHLTMSYMAFFPLFQAFPALLPALRRANCEAEAARLARVLEEKYPLQRIFKNERYVRVTQLRRSMEPMGQRILRMQWPGNANEWNYLLKPKAPAIEALDRYMLHWVEQAEQPVRSIATQSVPQALSELMNDETLQPDFFLREIVRYHYLKARLKLTCAALLLEAHRQKRGQYPATLTELNARVDLSDPFSNQPLRYRRNGAGYLLYSVGPDGQDDGGQTMVEVQLNLESKGDLTLSHRG